MKKPVRLKAKHHKLQTEWRGVEDSYGHGRCECGWFFKGWTERMRDVHRAHQGHLFLVLQNNAHVSARRDFIRDNDARQHVYDFYSHQRFLKEIRR